MVYKILLKSSNKNTQNILNQWLILKYTLSLLVSLMFLSCQTSKRAITDNVFEQLRSSFSKNQFTGVLIINPKTKDTLFKSNSEKYFTPASNVKIFTFYTGLRLIPKKIPALYYEVLGDTLYVQGTGDPTFLNPNLRDSTAYHFLKKHNHIALNPNNYSGNKFMPGWAWEDYQYYFSPELAAFPVHRNVVEIKARDSLTIEPKLFRNDVTVVEDYPLRNLMENQFHISEKIQDTIQIPFITSDSLLLRLLGDVLEVPITQTNRVLKNKKILKGMPIDSLYKQMLWDSDNFTAEQLMLVASSQLSDTLNFKTSRNHILENHLHSLRQPPRWVDGSGLSRYNLFSPESFVHVLEKIKNEVDSERLFKLFPAWTSEGTVVQPKQDVDYFIYAKSGSVGNVYNLSGYLKTKKGEILIFSFMNNHYRKPTIEIKNYMYSFLNMVREKY